MQTRAIASIVLRCVVAGDRGRDLACVKGECAAKGVNYFRLRVDLLLPSGQNVPSDSASARGNAPPNRRLTMTKFQIIETGKIIEAREWIAFVEAANGDQYTYAEVRRV